MESGGWFLIFLLVLILFICFVIAAYPRATQKWRNGCSKNVFFDKSRHFATALRSQKDADVLPEIPILATPTIVEFNQPSANVLIPKSGTYSVSYTVQLKWLQEATASLKVVSSDSKTEDLVGSQLQQTIAIASLEPVSHTFLASLKKGAILSVVVQANVPDSIVVPASDDPTILFAPTTLASISLIEI